MMLCSSPVHKHLIWWWLPIYKFFVRKTKIFNHKAPFHLLLISTFPLSLRQTRLCARWNFQFHNYIPFPEPFSANLSFTTFYHVWNEFELISVLTHVRLTGRRILVVCSWSFSHTNTTIKWKTNLVQIENQAILVSHDGMCLLLRGRWLYVSKMIGSYSQFSVSQKKKEKNGATIPPDWIWMKKARIFVECILQ